MNSAVPGDGGGDYSGPILNRSGPPHHAGEYRSLPYMRAQSAHTSPSKERAPGFQSGTPGFVSPLTCERNQPPSPSPHYSGQPGRSNGMIKNTSPVWQLVYVWYIKPVYWHLFFFCINKNNTFKWQLVLYSFNQPQFKGCGPLTSANFC